MTQTPNFQLVHLEEGQTGKETSVNTAFELIDKRFAQALAHNFTSDADYTLDTSNPAYEHLYYSYIFTDTSVLLTSARNINFPANRGSFAVQNQTAVNLNMRIGASDSGVLVGPSVAVRIYSDGSNMVLTAGAAAVASSSTSYDLPIFIGGLPNGSEAVEVVRPFTRDITFPAQPAAVPYRGTALVAATASTTMTFRKNGTSFGTVTFGAGSNTASFIQGSDTTFNAGDIFTVTGPVSQDATLANVALTLATTRL